MLTTNIEQFTAEAEAHRAADLYRGGRYYQPTTGQASFIGCHVRSGDAAVIERRSGVPRGIVRIAEHIFDRLPTVQEQADFAVAFWRAVRRDGRDLTCVKWTFLADLLRHLPATDVQDVVDRVIAGMDLLAAGRPWPEAKEAHAAARVAWKVGAAAEAATFAAEAAVWASRPDAEAWAAWAAADTAAAAEREEAATIWAAWTAAETAAWSAEIARQRDALLRLIAEANPGPGG